MYRQHKRIFAFFIMIFLTIQSTLILFAQNNVAAETDPMVVDGELDLQHHTIAENDPIELEGEWEFYWLELLSPEEVEDYTPHIVPVFDDWNNYSLDDQRLDRYGYATYFMTIQLNETAAGEVFSLYMPSIATAYDLWVNGELITSGGEVAVNRAEMTPGNRPHVVTFQTDTSEIELLLQVSNYHQRKSGLWEPITFGTAEQIADQRERSIILQVFVIGSIFIIGFYHIVLYFQRPKHQSALFLAIVCFCVAMRTMFLKDNLFVHLFPGVRWEIFVSIEYLVALIALIFFLLFVREGFSMKIPVKINRFFILALAVYSLFVIVTPARVFTNTFFIFQSLIIMIMVTIVIASIMGVLRRQEGAYLNLIAILVLSAAVMNDIFYYSNWISTDEFVSVGLLFYLFTQSIHLARRFSRSFDKVEHLTEELKQLNQTLERKVESRTMELQQANTRLQKMEEARRRLFANVSHELNTPLTFIQGYIKAMMDGVIPKDDSTYLRTVYDDTKMMSHMIDDLQMLSKLESGQIELSFELVEVRTFFSNLIEKEKAIFEKNGLALHYVEDIPADQTFVYIDPIRMEQAVMNLIINAEKYTPEGGSITLKLDFDKKASEQLSVSIIDTGTGIAEADLAHVFERFYKAKKKNNGSGKGGGLGLAIVKEIMDTHHGSVGVHSELGKGTTFFFTLPIQQKNEREHR
jgi:signal transduction histidine kinase